MKTTKIFALLLFALFATSSLSYAQKKKDLKEDVDQLTKDNTTLKSQNTKLTQENKNLQNSVDRLEKENGELRSDYNRLSKDFETFKKEAANNNAGNNSGGGASSGNSGVGSSGGSKGNAGGIINVPDPNDKRPCATKQNSLDINTTYTMNLTKLVSSGYGVQVGSSSNLCQAMEEAKEFAKYYKTYNTYIRVKIVGNQRMFAIVYGSLKDYNSAKSIAESVKKRGRNEQHKDAFVIQH